MKKSCTKCHVEKELSEFYTKGTYKDGSVCHNSWCIKCHRAYSNSLYKPVKVRKNAKVKLDYSSAQFSQQFMRELRA